MKTAVSGLYSLAALWLTATLLVACASEETDTGYTFKILQDEGFTIAETSGGPKFEGELFAYDEILRLEQDEQIMGSLLTMPRTVLMDDAGRFYVEDGDADRIVCFDESGHYLSQIGRQGEGPGEYRTPHLHAIQNGAVIIEDGRIHRVSRFSTDGTFLNSVRIPRTGMVLQECCFGPDDELILLGDFQRGFRDEYRFNTAVAFVYSSEGERLASVQSDSVKQSYFYRLEEYSTSSIAPVYFSSWPNVLYHPVHGLVMTSGLEPSLQCFDLQGRLQRKIRLDTPPQPVTSAEREAVHSHLREWIRQAENDRSRAVRQKQLELSEFQNPKAYFTVRFIDEYGYIWASRPFVQYRRTSTGEPPAEYLVFSPEGEYLGDTDLPMPSPQLLRDHIASRQEDEETGAIDIVIYVIRPIAPGFHYPEE